MTLQERTRADAFQGSYKRQWRGLWVKARTEDISVFTVQHFTVLCSDHKENLTTSRTEAGTSV